MKILVYPHDLGIGGSQLNAIELAHAVGELGHEVLVYGQPGPLSTRIAELGLELVESPPPSRRPTADIVSHLGELIDDRGIDIAHGYEWPPGLECYLACRSRPSTRAVTTVMSMAVAPFLPRTMPLAVGTEQIAAHEQDHGRQRVSVIEPPVDLEANQPSIGAAMPQLRRRFGLRIDQPVVVVVSRLARELKLEGLLTTIDAIAALHPDCPAQLLIVGDGEARREVAERAAKANELIGHRAVVLTGELADPRPAYDLADVCIAMGGSALRSLAFAKPLVVQGEDGFFMLLKPETLPQFLWAGWYGHGSRTGDPVGDLTDILKPLLHDHDRCRRLGQYGRTVVEDRFSLATAAVRQVQIYEDALEADPIPPDRTTEEIAAVAKFIQHHLQKRANRLRGIRAADDFNAKPVARQGNGSRSSASSS